MSEDELIGCDLTWRYDGADDWVLLHRRRRMGRVVPDNEHPGMYRVALARSRLSDMQICPGPKMLRWRLPSVNYSGKPTIVQSTPRNAQKRGLFLRPLPRPLIQTRSLRGGYPRQQTRP
jgi:hypothetical protein